MSGIKMTTNGAQINAEVFYLEKTIENCKQFLKDSGETQKQKILQWAESLERLYELGKSDIAPNRISGYIQRTAKREFGWTQGQCDYVTQVLDKRFKDSSHAPVSRVRSGLENLIPNYEQISIEIRNKAKAAQDREQLREIYKIAADCKESIANIADQKGIVIVDHIIKERKISTPKLKPGESYMHHYGAQVSHSLSKFTKDWYDLVEKINQYPPRDPKFDKKTAGLLLQFKSVVDKIDWYIQSLADERRAVSPLEWTGISSNKEIIGIPKHPETLKIDEIRQMSRKNIKKREVKMDRHIDELRDSVERMKPVLGEIIVNLSRWRDVESEFSNQVGTRRDVASDKLSECA